MNVAQIVIKTIITTLDLVLAVGTFKSGVEDNSKKALIILILMNLTGVWI